VLMMLLRPEGLWPARRRQAAVAARVNTHAG